GVAHHDLKQSNVMIAEAIDLTDSIHLLEYKLQTVTFKLIDMGLARRYPIERGLAIREETYVKGTALFCSAEKFAAPRLSYNPFLSDCYSLGVVLFWALLGSKAIKEQLRIQGARGFPERQAFFNITEEHLQQWSQKAQRDVPLVHRVIRRLLAPETFRCHAGQILRLMEKSV